MMKTFFLSLTAIVAIAGSTQAQSLNDDLAPKTTKAGATKSPRKVVRKSYKRPNSVRSTAAVQPVAVSAENSGQILARFMDFQQTGSVTQKDWDSVIKQSTQTLQANPNDANAKAQMLIAQGEMAYSRGDFSNALIHFNGASQVMPNSALPSYGIGRVYLATRQPAEAENSFEKAIKLNKGFALAHKGAGEALSAQGKAGKAKEYFENAAKLGLANGNVTRASVPQRTVAKNAATNNGRAANNASGNASAMYQTELRTARTLTARKKWQDSLNKLQPLAQSNPTADVYIAMGDNYVGLEQMLSAQQAFRKATELSPNSALAFYKTGTILLEMNEYKAAAESFEKSLILDTRGTTINRREARKMADRANDRLKNPNGKKRFLII